MSRFRTFVKWSLISTVLVTAVWLGVIIWWQATRRVVTVQDTLLYLGALPLAALVFIGLLQWRSARRQRQKEPSGSASAGDVAQGEPTAASEPVMQLPILSAWAITSFANNADDFMQALRDRQIRPLPDALLTDQQGFPLLTGRIAGVDTAAIQEDLTRIAAERKVDDIPDPESRREAFLRTLAVLGDLLDQVFPDLPLSRELPTDAQPDQRIDAMTLRGNAPLPSTPDRQLRLKIKLLLPAHFQPVEQQLALAYLLQRSADLPLSDQHMQLDIVQSTDDATALALIDQFGADTHADNRAQALLLLACDSTLCDTIVHDWQASGRLFHPRYPNGLMPGEAAFAILCANDSAVLAAAIDPVCRLTRVSRAQREMSADSDGKPSCSCLAGAVKNALVAANLSGDSIGMVACDADHRTNRALECMAAMMEHTPHLDAIQNRLAVAEACGHVGAASMSGALVAAVMQSKDAAHAVLLFNVSHVTDRAAAVLIPSGAAAA